MVEYTSSLVGIEAHQLRGFFEGWPNPPSQETHLKLLRGSSHVVIARAPSGAVVGFVTAISDGVLTAYIPFLEVVPEFRRRGVGKELVRRVLRELNSLYSINLHCDPELQPFYAAVGMRQLGGMAVRNYSAQSGRHVA